MKTILIQNADINATKKMYEAYGEDLAVSTVFATIQGEGPLAGHCAIFVRLAGCNFGKKDIACNFCDTSFFLDRARIINPKDLLNEILALPQYDKSQVLVITGGEPTLQHNLLAFITWATPYFSAIQIETNGTQASFYVKAEQMEIANTFKSVVSPKANNRTGNYAPISKTVLWWAKCLKFVVSSDPDSPHHDIPEWALESGKPIYVSPMAVYAKGYEGEVSSIWEDGLIDREATRANYEYAGMLTLKYNLLLSIQQHLFVSMA